jgi:hypothetical protein
MLADILPLKYFFINHRRIKMKKNSLFLGMLGMVLALGMMFVGCDNGTGGGDNSQLLEPVLFTGVTDGEVVTPVYNNGNTSFTPYAGGAKTFDFYETPDMEYVAAGWSGYNVSIGSDNRLTVQLGTPGDGKLVAYPYPSGLFDSGSVSISPSSARFLPIETFSTISGGPGIDGTGLIFSKALNAGYAMCSFIYCNTNAAFVAASGGIAYAINFKRGWNLLSASDSGYKWRVNEIAGQGGN